MSNNFSISDITDTTLDTLEQAMRLCGLPLTLSPDSYVQIGSGAWHDVYRVTVPQYAHPYIVRIRKTTNAYGKTQSYAEHASSWNAEYVATSLYYMQANRAQPNSCPNMFLHHVSENLTCTVETYMGQRLDLARLDKYAARRFGRQIGGLMRDVHQRKTHLQGEGELAWDGANLYGVSPRRHRLFANKIEQSYNENILGLLMDNLPSFDWRNIEQKLMVAHGLRNVDEPIVLINRDVTPENLTVQNGNRIGIIDPYPYLGNGTRFAAWFIHCYRFLLPAYAPTERYRKNGYDQYADVLKWMAEGFERAYVQDNPELAVHLTAERWLWALEQAHSDLERLLMDTLPDSKIIKHGTRDVMHRRLMRSLRLMETLEF